MKNQCVNSIFSTPVTFNEIDHYVNNLKSKHFCSFDELSAFVLTKIISKISYSLTLILNKSFQQGTFPDLSKIAQVVPIHKNGDVYDYYNYWSISILSTLFKIFEKLMLTRLISFINKIIFYMIVNMILGLNIVLVQRLLMLLII